MPADDRLIAEVHVSPVDIDTVRVGLRAGVRLPAYKQRPVPMVDGEVEFVGGDLTEDAARGISFYRARFAIDPGEVAALDGVELKAGMPVEAQIKTGERSFLHYFVQPLLDSFHRAFHEVWSQGRTLTRQPDGSRLVGHRRLYFATHASRVYSSSSRASGARSCDCCRRANCPRCLRSGTKGHPPARSWRGRAGQGAPV